MDEIEFKRAYNNLRVLIDHARTEDDIVAQRVHLCNALLTITAMLDGIHQRIVEMQVDEDDE